jgi:hypothetical protein
LEGCYSGALARPDARFTNTAAGMTRAVHGLLIFAVAGVACASAACQQPVSKEPKIPQAMHGCWELREAPSEEFPDGVSETVIIKGDRLIIDASGVGRRIGTIEKAERATPMVFEGLISARENAKLVTVATALELNPQGAPSGTLLLREGDAGSYHLKPCGPVTKASERTSLVIAESGRQVDPKPAPCGPNGACGDFLYRSTFRHAQVLVGAELPNSFEARLKLHTPYISSYVLALIVERQPDGALLVRRQAGFNGRNGMACFTDPEEWPVDWTPETVPGVRFEHGTLCVFDKSQIDPNAPKA